MKIYSKNMVGRTTILPFMGTEAVTFDKDGYAEVPDQVGQQIIDAVEYIFDGPQEDMEKVAVTYKDLTPWNELPEGLSEDVITFIKKVKIMSRDALSQLMPNIENPPTDWTTLSNHDLAQFIIDVIVDNSQKEAIEKKGMHDGPDEGGSPNKEVQEIKEESIEEESVAIKEDDTIDAISSKTEEESDIQEDGTTGVISSKTEEESDIQEPVIKEVKKSSKK